MRSCCFTSTFASSIPYAVCGFNRTFGSGTSYSGLLLGFIFSNSIWFENRGRWSLISVWVFAQWLEGYFLNYSNKTKLITRLTSVKIDQLLKGNIGSKLTHVRVKYS